MKKVMIYIDKTLLAPIGGPIGYNYQLFTEMNGKFEYDDLEFCFLNSKNRLKDFIRPFVPQFIRNYRIKQLPFKQLEALSSSRHRVGINLNNYDYIHFHNTMDMYMVKDSLDDYKGKVVITSHSPLPMHLEFFSEQLSGKEEYERYIPLLESVDEYAFRRADYIIFPTEFSEEPYFNNWGKYAAIHNENSDKYRYLLTGCVQKVPKISRKEIRKRYGIPENAFLICYVGRHNTIKGYVDLKRVCLKIIETVGNVYVICAGKETPERGNDHPHWIECGWCDDTESIINASDLFILPNRETYFDLVLLEVLSIGTPLLISRTGGNKFFERLSGDGVWLYDNTNDDDMACFIKDFISVNSDAKMQKYRERNKILYNKYFTKELFLNNYLKLIRSLV